MVGATTNNPTNKMIANQTPERRRLRNSNVIKPTNTVPLQYRAPPRGLLMTKLMTKSAIMKPHHCVRRLQNDLVTINAAIVITGRDRTTLERNSRAGLDSTLLQSTLEYEARVASPLIPHMDRKMTIMRNDRSNAIFIPVGVIQRYALLRVLFVEG